MAVVAFRLANAWAVATQFDPDEVWQAAEVAHRLAFGYGHLSWEWTHAARSHAHVAPFALLFHLLRLGGIDSPWLVALAPRLLQALLAAAADLALARFAAVYFDDETVANEVLLSSFSCWFMWYCAVRPYSSSMEASILPFLLSRMASPGALTLGRSGYDSLVVGSLCALACMVRPTALLLLPPLLFHALPSSRTALCLVVLGALITAAPLLLLDLWLYGEWVLPALNFLRFNLLSDGASYYGTHPWHWYLSSALPAVFTTHLPLACVGAYRSARKLAPLAAAACAVLLLSLPPHKELRFLLPTLPMLLLYVPLGVRAFPPSRRRVCWASLFACNGVAAWYLSRWHQRAPIEAFEELRAEAALGRVSRIDLLTRCHQTPAFAQLHSPVVISMLECPPPGLHRLRSLTSTDQTPRPFHPMPSREPSLLSCANECDCFFLDFERAVAHRLCSSSELPSHILIFEDNFNQGRTRRLFVRLGYSIIGKFAHDLRYQGNNVAFAHAWHWHHLLLLRHRSHASMSRRPRTRAPSNRRPRAVLKSRNCHPFHFFM